MCKCVKPVFKGGTGRGVTHWRYVGGRFPLILLGCKGNVGGYDIGFLLCYVVLIIDRFSVRSFADI